MGLPGALQTYQVDDVSPGYSSLEMRDMLNESLEEPGQRRVGFPP